MKEEADSNRIESIFHEALTYSKTEERRNFLDLACDGDGVLRSEVERLVEAHGENDEFLEKGFRGPVRIESEKSGDVVGHYRIISTLGEGGFGVVWRAEQAAPVRREVALKIIKIGMDTREVITRFEQERQALAILAHPNIAKVFDAGATPTGRPFFAMELVEGIRITDFCDRECLPTTDRLNLFMQVCHAVQHAHQKGIIHRDLKPSNILVTLQDGVAAPKIIDFGVAKATREKLIDATLLTLTQHLIGTPHYLSPEQAVGNSTDIDTRSDIYSLGVVLFELLTGQLPFAHLTATGVDELRRVIQEQEPRRPSTALGSMTREGLTVCASQRNCEPLKLIGAVRGDLDWIVMRALEKDRNRRYQTADAFAEDIERHLRCEPVYARPPSAAYRLRKFARRNKAPLAAAAAVLIALLGGIAASTWESGRANATLAELRASVPAFVEQAHSLAMQERFDEAIEKLDYALKLRPDTFDLVLAKANLLEAQLRLADAVPVYRIASHLKESDPRPKANSSVCEELLSQAMPGKSPPYPREGLAKLHSIMVGEHRSAAELMPLARILGEQNNLLLEYWQTRLSNLPVTPDRPLSQRLTLRKDGLLALDLSGTQVSDLTSLEGMPLAELDCTDCRFVADLTCARDMPLQRLLMRSTVVSDLSSVTTLGQLKELDIAETKVVSLQELRGLELRVLHLDKLDLTDLDPLAGMPLEELTINSTRVIDLAPLAQMPLRRLEMDGTPCHDLGPLAALPLEFLSMAATRIYGLHEIRELPLKQLFLGGTVAFGLDGLDKIASLERLVLPEIYCDDSDPRFRMVSALQRHPSLRAIGMSNHADRNLAQLETPEVFWPEWEKRNRVFAYFRNLAKDMSVELHVQPDRTWDLSAKKARYDTDAPRESLEILKGAPVSKLTLVNLPVYDITPLAAMPLRSLEINNCPIERLEPISGVALEELSIERTKVHDLTPVGGMPLKRLCIDETPVADLTPLRGMKIEQLWTGTTRIRSIEPLRGMPLRLLHIDGCPVLEDVSPAADLPLLEQIWLPSHAINVERLRGHPRLKYISYEFDGLLQRPKHSAEEFWSMERPANESQLAYERKFPALERLIRSRLKNRSSSEEWKDYRKLAAVLLMQNDYWGYRDACSAMMVRYQNTLAWNSCSIATWAPELGVTKDELRSLIKAAGEQGRPGTSVAADALLAGGLGQFRLGDVDNAERELTLLLAGDGEGARRTMAEAVLAMIRCRRGDYDFAAARLTLATRNIQAEMQKTNLPGWQDWLVAGLLVKEAEGLLPSPSYSAIGDPLHDSR